MCQTRKNHLKSALLPLLAILLGIGGGFSDHPYVLGSAKTISELFLRLLKLISLPLIFLSITATISGMRDLAEMKRMGKRVFLYTLGTTLVAATVALVLFLAIKPAENILPQEGAEIAQKGSYLQFLWGSIPSNIVQPFLEGNVIAIAFIALLFSLATLFLPADKKGALHTLFSSLLAMMLKVTSYIIKFMPIAIFAFITLLIVDLRSNLENGRTLFYYLLTIILANLLQGILILPLLLKMKGISPLKTFSNFSPALAFAFFSKSSNATLPITLDCAEKRGGISEKTSQFTLPLAAVINMNGCAAFILTTTLFVCTLSGVHFLWYDYVGWIFLATLAAIGNAGVPMGCYFLTTAFLLGMNMPLMMMGLILPFYTFLDMLETALNVWSDACITTCVEKDLIHSQVNLERL